MHLDALRCTSTHFDALRCTSKGWSMHSPLGCYTRYISNRLNCTDYFINSRNCTAYLSKIVKPSRMHLLLLLFKTIAFEAFEIVQCCPVLNIFIIFKPRNSHTLLPQFWSILLPQLWISHWFTNCSSCPLVESACHRCRCESKKTNILFFLRNLRNIFVFL